MINPSAVISVWETGNAGTHDSDASSHVPATVPCSILCWNLQDAGDPHTHTQLATRVGTIMQMLAEHSCKHLY